MFCYTPGTACCALVAAVAYWRLHAVIAEVFHWAWIVMGWFAVAAAATTAAIVATLIVAFIAWTAQLIRRRQAARGACLACSFPCQEAQVEPAQVKPWQRLNRPPAPPVALPMPRSRPAPAERAAR